MTTINDKIKDIIKIQSTFFNYDINKTQALEFNLVNKDFIDNVRNNGYLFMRKVTFKSYVDVNYILLDSLCSLHNETR